MKAHLSSFDSLHMHTHEPTSVAKYVHTKFIVLTIYICVCKSLKLLMIHGQSYDFAKKLLQNHNFRNDNALQLTQQSQFANTINE